MRKQFDYTDVLTFNSRQKLRLNSIHLVGVAVVPRLLLDLRTGRRLVDSIYFDESLTLVRRHILLWVAYLSIRVQARANVNSHEHRCEPHDRVHDQKVPRPVVITRVLVIHRRNSGNTIYASDRNTRLVRVGATVPVAVQIDDRDHKQKCLHKEVEQYVAQCEAVLSGR